MYTYTYQITDHNENITNSQGKEVETELLTFF